MAELDLTTIASTSIATPGPGVVAVFADSTGKLIKSKDDTGYVMTLGDITSFSTAAQTPAATTRTYITGSKVTVPKGKLQIGTYIRWTFDITKTNAGTAASTYDIAFGTAGTTADTARVSFTKPAGTAAVDTAIVTITALVRGPLTSQGVVAGTFQLVKNAAEAAGHCTTPSVALSVVSSAFDVTVADLFVGLCVTTGTSDAITIQSVLAEVYNL